MAQGSARLERLGLILFFSSFLCALLLLPEFSRLQVLIDPFFASIFWLQAAVLLIFACTRRASRKVALGTAALLWIFLGWRIYGLGSGTYQGELPLEESTRLPDGGTLRQDIVEGDALSRLRLLLTDSGELQGSLTLAPGSSVDSRQTRSVATRRLATQVRFASVPVSISVAGRSGLRDLCLVRRQSLIPVARRWHYFLPIFLRNDASARFFRTETREDLASLQPKGLAFRQG